MEEEEKKKSNSEIIIKKSNSEVQREINILISFDDVTICNIGNLILN